MANNTLRIFISSTMDLKKERNAVTEVINQIEAVPIKMEFFTARDSTPEQVCIDELTKSDIYVGIFADKYGYIPSINNPKNLSVTVMEFQKAKDKGIPCLIFIKSSTENRDPQLTEFLSEISNFNKGIFRKTFGTIKDLKYWVLASIVYYLSQEIENKEQKNRLELLLPTESLYKEYLRKTCEYADFKGIYQLRRVVQLKLSDIYVPTRLSKMETISDKILEMTDSENSELKAKLANSQESLFFKRRNRMSLIIDQNAVNQINVDKSFALEETIAPNKKTVILGGPGSGKTTMLRHLTGKLVTEKDSTLFPILIPLREYVRLKKIEQNTSILDFLANYFTSHDLNLSPNFFEKYLFSGGCVVMFDGLDEILLEQDRIEAATKIEQFAACFGEGNSIIVTSRIPSYRLVQLTGFEHYTVQQLFKTQIKEFITKWFQLVDGNCDGESSQALISILFEDANLLTLSTNPLMLSLICLISLQGIPIPKRKADLYDICIRTLSSSWEAKKGFNGVLSEPQRFDIIKKLAFAFLDQKKVSATEYEVISLLDEFLVEQQVSEEDPKNSSYNIFKAITERSGFLVEREPNNFGFVHMGIRDYLAALHLAGMDNVKDMFKIHLWKKLHSQDYEQTICLCSRCLAQQSFSRVTVFLNEIFNAGTPYEELAHCDLNLSVKCLFNSGITQGNQASIILNKMYKVLKKGVINESHLVIFALMEADYETLENQLSKLLWEIEPKTSISFLEVFALSRNVPENSKLLDIILDYVKSQMDDSQFEFEISLIIGQLVKKGSKKATDLAIEIMENSNKDIAYPLSVMVTLFGSKYNEYFRQRVLNFQFRNDNCSTLLLVMVNQADSALANEMISKIIKQDDPELVELKNFAKTIPQFNEESEKDKKRKQDEECQELFEKLLNPKNETKISESQIESLMRAHLSELKLIESVDKLRTVFKSNKLFAFRLCEIYAINMKQYPSLSKEINRLIITLTNDDSHDSKMLLSYIAIEVSFPEGYAQKQLLLELVREMNELTTIREAALLRLDKLELSNEELGTLFNLSSSKEIQENIFALLLRRSNFDRAIVIERIVNEINKGNTNLYQILNVGVHLNYGEE